MVSTTSQKAKALWASLSSKKRHKKQVTALMAATADYCYCWLGCISAVNHIGLGGVVLLWSLALDGDELNVL
jgi:hypothetical protein